MSTLSVLTAYPKVRMVHDMDMKAWASWSLISNIANDSGALSNNSCTKTNADSLAHKNSKSCLSCLDIPKDVHHSKTRKVGYIYPLLHYDKSMNQKDNWFSKTG